MTSVLLWGLLVALIVVIVCALIRIVEVRRRARALRNRIDRELYQPTHYVGAWMISVRKGAARSLVSEVRRLAARTEPPENIVNALGRVDGKVLDHRRGPSAELEEHARAWLDGAARRVGSILAPELLGASARPIVIVAYASKEPPPRRATLGDVRAHLTLSIGAALIICRPGEATLAHRRGRLVDYIGLAGFGVAVIFAAIALSVLRPQPEPIRPTSLKRIAVPHGASTEYDPGGASPSQSYAGVRPPTQPSTAAGSGATIASALPKPKPSGSARATFAAPVTAKPKPTGAIAAIPNGIPAAPSASSSMDAAQVPFDASGISSVTPGSIAGGGAHPPPEPTQAPIRGRDAGGVPPP